MYRRNPYNTVIPAQAGIHAEQDPDAWVPAYAGTTSSNGLSLMACKRPAITSDCGLPLRIIPDSSERKPCPTFGGVRNDRTDDSILVTQAYAGMAEFARGSSRDQAH